MDKVKERMRQLKDAVEEAQERETQAKNKKRETEAVVDRLGGEKTTLLSRINNVRAELDKINERLDESQDKLERAVERSEESEAMRKQLAETEVDDFERSEEMENTMKATKAMKENADHLVVEGERKILVLEADLARAQEKHEKLESRIEELTDVITDKSETIRDLEEKDRDASEREGVTEEKLKFLETQLSVSLTAADTQERQVGKLERLREDLTKDIYSWREKREKILQEMEDGMDNILDED